MGNQQQSSKPTNLLALTIAHFLREKDVSETFKSFLNLALSQYNSSTSSLKMCASPILTSVCPMESKLRHASTLDTSSWERWDLLQSRLARKPKELRTNSTFTLTISAKNTKKSCHCALNSSRRSLKSKTKRTSPTHATSTSKRIQISTVGLIRSMPFRLSHSKKCATCISSFLIHWGRSSALHYQNLFRSLICPASIYF